MLSFSNVLVWTVESASKRQCGRESIVENAYYWKRISVDRALVSNLYLSTLDQASYSIKQKTEKIPVSCVAI